MHDTFHARLSGRGHNVTGALGIGRSHATGIIGEKADNRGKMIDLFAAFGHAFQITEPGWRQLTIRWIVFFLVMAGLNEAVWRNVSTDSWVTFKVFGVLGLTILFTILQVPLFQKHQLEEA